MQGVTTCVRWGSKFIALATWGRRRDFGACLVASLDGSIVIYGIARDGSEGVHVCGVAVMYHSTYLPRRRVNWRGGKS
jgi:hypothetical protein